MKNAPQCELLQQKSGTVHTMDKIKVETHVLSGGTWIAAWLFTLGFLQLTFWKGVLALFIWPYYLGVYFSVPY